MTNADHHLFGEVAHTLAESPLYHQPTHTLWWVDIPEGEIWSRPLGDDGSQRRYGLGRPVGAIAFAGPGTILAAADDGVFLLDVDTGDLSLLWAPNVSEPGRFNDARVDPKGQLWLGWLTHARQRPGVVYRLGAGGPEIIVDDLIAPNGIGFSPDGNYAYVTDSHANEIRIYNISSSDNSPQRSGTLAHQPRSAGIFDGLAVDVEGNIWSALYRAAAVVCLAPDGREVRRLTLPARQVTSLALVPDGQMIITSGHRGYSQSDRIEEPLAGRLFSVPCPFEGLQEKSFAFTERLVTAVGNDAIG